MENKYVMVDENRELKIVKIVNINGSTYTDSNNNKYNEEKVKYIWEKGFPKNNPKYVFAHLLEEGGK